MLKNFDRLEQCILGLKLLKAEHLLIKDVIDKAQEQVYLDDRQFDDFLSDLVFHLFDEALAQHQN